MPLLYDIALGAYQIGIRLAAPFNKKAAAWIQGRKVLFEQLEQSNLSDGRKLVWIHAASLGEFEQGRPLMEQIKQAYPQCKILLTFFSPSGYEIRKDYELADFVSYLPLDTARNAQRFIQLTKPDLAIFIKYELWYHFFQSLQKAKTPTLLISALFREQQFFFKRYGQWFKKTLAKLDHFFVQNEHSAAILRNHQIGPVTVNGDTRVDRVAKLAKQPKSFPIIDTFAAGKPVLVFGSTWPADEEIIHHYIQKNPNKWRYIIAAHDIRPQRIEYIEHLFQAIKSIRYSQAAGVNLKDYNLLIIDNIGMLSALYHYAKVVYIGGAFGKGLHNTLEPIAFGKPVIFGTKYQKFEEAKYLVEHGGGFSIASSLAFEQVMKQLEQASFYQQAAERAQQYIKDNAGATAEIMRFIKEKQYLE